MKISRKQIVRFHSELESRFGVRFVNSGIFASIAKLFFWRLKHKLPKQLQNEERFDDLFDLMRPCAVGRLVLLRWTPGCKGTDYAYQLRVAIHEVVHCIRIRQYKGSPMEWYNRYFTEPNFRALEEASAQEDVAEVWYWLTRQVRELNLGGYLLTEVAHRIAHSSYETRMREMTNRGPGTTFGIVSSASKGILQRIGIKPE
jgi:hypothetical protein